MLPAFSARFIIIVVANDGAAEQRAERLLFRTDRAPVRDHSSNDEFSLCGDGRTSPGFALRTPPRAAAPLRSVCAHSVRNSVTLNCDRYLHFLDSFAGGSAQRVRLDPDKCRPDRRPADWLMGGPGDEDDLGWSA